MSNSETSVTLTCLLHMRMLLLLCAVGCACGSVTAPADSGSTTDGGSASNDGGGEPGLDSGTAIDGGACGAGVLPSDAVVLTERGALRGLRTDAGISYLGIPYVRPPIGSLRWAPPQVDATCWPAIREAQTWAPKCPQQPQDQSTAFDASTPVEGSEDCLTLNVFVPPGVAPDGGWPVMTFIHGGGNTIGSAEEVTAGIRIYDGSRLATRGEVVVVTVQYRLGVMGYLVLPDAGIRGNYGLQDQQQALQWVQRNIARFGGDPRRVLLFGESAGGVNTCNQLAMPGAENLFSRALIQSGACSSTRPFDAVAAEGSTWLQATGCAGSPDVAACVRALSPEAAVKAIPVAVAVGSRRPPQSWGPVIDGTVMPRLPLEALRMGLTPAIPLVVGSNAEETNLSTPRINTELEYRAFVVAQLGQPTADAALMRYPSSTYGTPRKALVQLTSDVSFTCPTRSIARAAVRGHPTQPVYRYLFSRAPVAARGAFHGVELLYVFQQAALVTPNPPAADLAVEAQVLAGWTGFARTGRLGSPWAAYDAAETAMDLDAPMRSVSAWRNSECDFWDTVTGFSVAWPP